MEQTNQWAGQANSEHGKGTLQTKLSTQFASQKVQVSGDKWLVWPASCFGKWHFHGKGGFGGIFGASSMLQCEKLIGATSLKLHDQNGICMTSTNNPTLLNFFIGKVSSWPQSKWNWQCGQFCRSVNISVGAAWESRIWKMREAIAASAVSWRTEKTFFCKIQHMLLCWNCEKNGCRHNHKHKCKHDHIASHDFGNLQPHIPKQFQNETQHNQLTQNPCLGDTIWWTFFLLVCNPFCHQLLFLQLWGFWNMSACKVIGFQTDLTMLSSSGRAHALWPWQNVEWASAN